MAQTHNTAPQASKPNGAWKQPTVYHAVSATGRGRGYFVRVPHSSVLDTIAEVYGADVAQHWHRAMLRYLTQLGQARASAKDVAQTREAETAAIEKAFSEFANGTLSVRGDDTDESESNGGFAAAFRRHPKVRDTVRNSLAQAGHPTTDDYIDTGISQYWDSLLSMLGNDVAAEGYTPTKRGAGGAKADKPKLELKL